MRSLRVCVGIVMIAGLVDGMAVLKAQDSRIRAILEWQDQRRPVDSTIIAALHAPDVSVRHAALIALANKQDSSAVDLMTALLADPVVAVRAAAAFSLGQTVCAASSRAVREALAAEKDPTVLMALADAMGKTGSADDLNAMLSSGKTDIPILADSALVGGLLRFSIRGIKSDAMIRTCFGLLDGPASEVRWRALYALWRVAPNAETDTQLIARAASLRALMDDSDPNVRMQLATLLGRCSSDTAATLLRDLYATESRRPDWRVQVQAVRAAGQQVAAHPAFLDLLVDALSSDNPHVTITALQAVTGLPPAVLKDSSALRDRIRADLRTLSGGDAGVIEAVRGEAMVATGRQFEPDLERILPLLDRSDIAPRLKARILEAVAQHASKRNLSLLLRFLGHDSTRVTMASWDFLRRVMVPQVVQILQRDSAYWAPVPSRLARSAAEVLGRHDGGIATVVAGFFADTTMWRMTFDGQQRSLIRGALLDALRRMSSDRDAEAMQAVIGTLGLVGDTGCVSALRTLCDDADATVVEAARGALIHLTGEAPPANASAYQPPRHLDEDWTTLAWARHHPIVTMITSRGGVTLELLSDAAPWTVVTFVKLARSGFYNGLLFHRVVPNFVVQGGDPRGDGWGGPGFTIRTEIAQEQYDRGSCGMASAGKDTEGCQFFITHCPTPHLDGRYTIFARVIEGMTAVDRIQIGDRILSVDVSAR